MFTVGTHCTNDTYRRILNTGVEHDTGLAGGRVPSVPDEYAKGTTESKNPSLLLDPDFVRAKVCLERERERERIVGPCRFYLRLQERISVCSGFCRVLNAVSFFFVFPVASFVRFIKGFRLNLKAFLL
jgi:hypothetical protein